MGIGKWVGGSIGWAFGGPIGALIGFTIGAVIDSSKAVVHFDKEQQYTTGNDYRYKTTSSDFAVSLLVLSAAVMKADGKVLKSELKYVKDFYNQNFGVAATNEAMPMLKKLLGENIPLADVCGQIRYNMQHPLRLQLLHYLFGISLADGQVDQSEVQVIHQISNYLGISAKDFESIKAMFYKDTVSDYKILEIEQSATNDEVKKAYRKMAIKYHPDKVAQLGAEFQKAAKDKFQKVQAAYENIKKERGMN